MSYATNLRLRFDFLRYASISPPKAVVKHNAAYFLERAYPVATKLAASGLAAVRLDALKPGLASATNVIIERGPTKPLRVPIHDRASASSLMWRM